MQQKLWVMEQAANSFFFSGPHANFALGQTNDQKFLSRFFTEATNNVNEMLLALAVLFTLLIPVLESIFDYELK